MAPLLSAANVIILTILLVAKSFSAGAAVSDATDANVPVVYSFSERALIEASFSTIAGTDSSSGGYNGDSIPANNAYLNLPFDIQFDALGNLHFLDYGNSRIRKVDKDTGIITTVAGTGQTTFNGDGFLAVNADLFPAGFTFDVFGDLFVADLLNFRVRKVALATGIITTVAGNGGFGYNGDNILATTASLHTPRAITSDSQGNIYFADNNGCRVRKVTRSTGLITTVAGNGERASSSSIPNNVLATSINISPTHLVIDTSGDLYSVDYVNNFMVKISSSTGKIVKSRTIDTVGNIFLDAAGTLYYTDIAANKIYKELANGEIFTVATNVYSMGICVDTTGSIYVSASELNKIFKVDLNGNVAAFPTSRFPTSLSTPKPTMEVTSPSTQDEFGYIRVVGSDTTSGGYNGNGLLAMNTRLNLPSDIAFDGEGNLYIADAGNTRVRRVDKSTGIVTTVAGFGAGGYTGDGASALLATFLTVSKIAFDVFGDLYILDAYRVRKVTTATGIISTVAGNGEFAYQTGGKPATASSIGVPTHIACGPEGNLFILDVYNQVVWKVDRITGIMTVAFGNRETGVFVIGSYYNLSPTAMALDAAGDLYLSDKSLRTIMKVTLSTGAITLFAPRFEEGGSMFVDASGNIYYMEISVGQVRKITVSTGVTTIVARNQYFTGSICGDSSGKIYVAGYEKHAVFLVPLDTTGEVVPAVTPTPPTRSPFMITTPPTAPPTSPPSPRTAPSVTAPPTSPTPLITNPPLTRPSTSPPTREPTRRPTSKPILRPNRRRPSKAPMCKPPRRFNGHN
jgi:trimeric autotransporter adhesin